MNIFRLFWSSSILLQINYSLVVQKQLLSTPLLYETKEKNAFVIYLPQQYRIYILRVIYRVLLIILVCWLLLLILQMNNSSFKQSY